MQEYIFVDIPSLSFERDSKFILLFKKWERLGVGNFCGYYGAEYFTDADAIYCINVSKYGTILAHTEYKQHFEKIDISSIYRSQSIIAVDDEDAINKFINTYKRSNNEMRVKVLDDRDKSINIYDVNKLSFSKEYELCISDRTRHKFKINNVVITTYSDDELLLLFDSELAAECFMDVILNAGYEDATRHPCKCIVNPCAFHEDLLNEFEKEQGSTCGLAPTLDSMIN